MAVESSGWSPAWDQASRSSPQLGDTGAGVGRRPRVGALDVGPHIGHGPAGQFPAPSQLGAAHDVREGAGLPVVDAVVLPWPVAKDLVAPEQLLRAFYRRDDLEQGDGLRLSGQ